MRFLSRDTTVYGIIIAQALKPSCYFHRYGLHQHPNISYHPFCFALVVVEVALVALIFDSMEQEASLFSMLIFGADQRKTQHSYLVLI